MNQQGWERLLCNYFYTVCLKVLSAYFSEYGFVPEKNKVGGVTFRKHDIFVEISYDPETYPRYSLTMVVGVGAGAYDDWGKFTGIPIWSIMPEDGVSSEFSTWIFSDEHELEDVLTKTKTMVLDKYIKPLWENKVKLEEEIKQFLAR
ncbi:MAG TPA: hypothetical protein EYP90_09770 [Chromatiaceae bacterium]|nr:hypothetical protein [Chromatiaceae bacterium]